MTIIFKLHILKKNDENMIILLNPTQIWLSNIKKGFEKN